MARYRDPRLRALRNPRNLGLAGNVERGIAEARGACVAILGADDIWRPDFLARAVAVLDRHPAMTMVHGPAVWIDEAGRPFGGTGHVWPPRTPGARAMLEAFGAGFCFSTMLMRTDAIRATGPFDPRWQEVIDLWLFLRMCLAGEVGYLDEVLVEYRVHAAAMSMPMYRQNLMFRRQMAAAREAFRVARRARHRRRSPPAGGRAARGADRPRGAAHEPRRRPRPPAAQFRRGRRRGARDPGPAGDLGAARLRPAAAGGDPAPPASPPRPLPRAHGRRTGRAARMNRTVAIDALLVVAGRIAFVGLWFVAVLLVYRGLGASAEGLTQAGLFAVAIAFVKVVSGCLSDPIDLAVMRRAPPLLQAGDARGLDVLRAAVGLRLGAALAVAVAMVAGAPLAATHLLHQPQQTGLVLVLAAAVLGDLTMRSVLVVQQAHERFRSFVLLEGLAHVLRFGAIAALWATGTMQVDRVLAAYAAAPFAVVAAGAFVLPRALLRSARVRAGDVLDLIHYLKWMVPAMVLAALNERLDVFLVYARLGSNEAGLYGAMLTLALMPDIVAGCLSTILQPRIVGLRESGRFAETTRRFLMVSVPLCAAAFLAALVLAQPVIAVALNPRYEPGVPALSWLLAGTLFWLAVTPLPMTLVALVAPQRIVLVTLGQSVIVLLGGVTLLPWLGLVGMAQTICAMRVAVAVVLLLVARGMTARTAGPARSPARPGGAVMRSDLLLLAAVGVAIFAVSAAAGAVVGTGLFVGLVLIGLVYLQPMIGLGLMLLAGTALQVLGSEHIIRLPPHLGKIAGIVTLAAWLARTVVHRTPLTYTPQLPALAAFITLCLVVSTLASEHPMAREGLFRYLQLFLLFFMIVSVAGQSPRLARRRLPVADGLHAGVVDHRADGVLLPSLAIESDDPSLVQGAIGAIVDRDSLDGVEIKRITGGLSDSNWFAYTLVAVLPLNLYLWQRYASLEARLFILAAAALQSVGIVLSFTRRPDRGGGGGARADRSAPARRRAGPALRRPGRRRHRGVESAGLQRLFSVEYLREGSTPLRSYLLRGAVALVQSAPCWGSATASSGPPSFLAARPAGRRLGGDLGAGTREARRRRRGAVRVGDAAQHRAADLGRVRAVRAALLRGGVPVLPERPRGGAPVRHAARAAAGGLPARRLRRAARLHLFGHLAPAQDPVDRPGFAAACGGCAGARGAGAASRRDRAARMTRTARALRRLALTLGSGYVLFFFSERVFWSLWRPGDEGVVYVATWLLYALFAYLLLATIRVFAVRPGLPLFRRARCSAG